MIGGIHMPLLAEGAFVHNVQDYPYEAEATYHLKYFISSALITLDLILNPDHQLIGRFDNSARYYRYHLDHLFYLLGQINDRLIYKPGRDAALNIIKQEHVNLNRNNYRFSEQEFPIISNKIPRNLIEHLDERNLTTLTGKRGVGGFNVIHPDSDPDMVASIKSNRDLYPYNLDLIERKVLFFNAQEKDPSLKQFDIDINELKSELIKLSHNVNALDDLLSIY